MNTITAVLAAQANQRMEARRLTRRFSIRIVGPSGAEWHLTPNDERGPYTERQTFTTAGEAEDHHEKIAPVFRARNFLTDVIDSDGE